MVSTKWFLLSYLKEQTGRMNNKKFCTRSKLMFFVSSKEITKYIISEKRIDGSYKPIYRQWVDK